MNTKKVLMIKRHIEWVAIGRMKKTKFTHKYLHTTIKNTIQHLERKYNITNIELTRNGNLIMDCIEVSLNRNGDTLVDYTNTFEINEQDFNNWKNNLMIHERKLYKLLILVECFYYVIRNNRH